MASSRIPEEISQYRPGPCTEIKLINGHYYVYMYQSVHLPSGKWGKKTGKSIGTIIPDKGFVPNRNYHLYTGREGLNRDKFYEFYQECLKMDLSAMLELISNTKSEDEKSFYTDIYNSVLRIRQGEN